MGVRELIWALIALLAGYVVWQLFRAQRARKIAARTDPAAAVKRAAAGKARQPAAGDEGKEAEQDDEGDEEFESYAPAPRPAASAVPAAGAPCSLDSFQAEFELQQLRRELAQLRAEQQAQRQELSALGDGLRALREQFDASQTSQGVSPQYDEALVFARRGLDADAIAERCGISVAEAQLVLSLARGGPGGRREGR